MALRNLLKDMEADRSSRPLQGLIDPAELLDHSTPTEVCGDHPGSLRGMMSSHGEHDASVEVLRAGRRFILNVREFDYGDCEVFSSTSKLVDSVKRACESLRARVLEGHTPEWFESMGIPVDEWDDYSDMSHPPTEFNPEDLPDRADDIAEAIVDHLGFDGSSDLVGFLVALLREDQVLSDQGWLIQNGVGYFCVRSSAINRDGESEKRNAGNLDSFAELSTLDVEAFGTKLHDHIAETLAYLSSPTPGSFLAAFEANWRWNRENPIPPQVQDESCTKPKPGPAAKPIALALPDLEEATADPCSRPEDVGLVHGLEALQNGIEFGGRLRRPERILVPEDLGVSSEVWRETYELMEDELSRLADTGDRPPKIGEDWWDYLQGGAIELPDHPPEPAIDGERPNDRLKIWADLCHWAAWHGLELLISPRQLVHMPLQECPTQRYACTRGGESMKAGPGWVRTAVPSPPEWSKIFSVLLDWYHEMSMHEADRMDYPRIEDFGTAKMKKLNAFEFVDPNRDRVPPPPWLRYNTEDLSEARLKHWWHWTVAWADRHDALDLLLLKSDAE